MPYLILNGCDLEYLMWTTSLNIIALFSHNFLFHNAFTFERTRDTICRSICPIVVLDWQFLQAFHTCHEYQFGHRVLNGNESSLGRSATILF